LFFLRNIFKIFFKYYIEKNTLFLKICFNLNFFFQIKKVIKNIFINFGDDFLLELKNKSLYNYKFYKLIIGLISLIKLIN